MTSLSRAAFCSATDPGRTKNVTRGPSCTCQFSSIGFGPSRVWQPHRTAALARQSAVQPVNRRSSRIRDARHDPVTASRVGAQIEEQSFAAPHIRDDRADANRDADFTPSGEIRDPAGAPARILDRNVRLTTLTSVKERGGIGPIGFGAEAIARTKSKSGRNRDRSADVGFGQRHAAVVMCQYAAFAGASYADAGVQSAHAELAGEIPTIVVLRFEKRRAVVRGTRHRAGAGLVREIPV